MKQLSTEVKALLEKLYNLRGKDSVILAKMNAEREEAIATQERTKTEKEGLLKEIETLTEEEKSLEAEGTKLMSALESIHKDDFAFVLERLGLDFDPEGIHEKVAKLLPETMAKINEANKTANEKLENVEIEMNNAITKAEELGIRKDEALSNQARLNDIFDLALKGNINITREEITSLLEKFEFSHDEQREAAKILMFPEDALYDFDASFKNGGEKPTKTITDVLVEAKQNNQADTNETKKENENLASVKASAEQESKLENIFEKVVDENVSKTEINNDIEKTEEIKKEEEKNPREELEKVLLELEVNPQALSSASMNKLLEHFDPQLIKNNMAVLKEYKIDFIVIKDNVELLYDKELKEKIEKLINIGKEAQDINLMPSVLLKYDLKGLNNTINVLQVSGLDPKQVPLMAY